MIPEMFPKEKMHSSMNSKKIERFFFFLSLSEAFGVPYQITQRNWILFTVIIFKSRRFSESKFDTQSVKRQYESLWVSLFSLFTRGKLDNLSSTSVETPRTTKSCLFCSTRLDCGLWWTCGCEQSWERSVLCCSVRYIFLLSVVMWKSVGDRTLQELIFNTAPVGGERRKESKW